MNWQVERRFMVSVCVLGSALAVAKLLAADEPKDSAETVMITYRPKAGSEQALKRQIAQHWQQAVELNLVRESPHLFLKTSVGGHENFVEIFAWRDAGIPDQPPPAIQAIWAEMAKLVETRDDRPGIEIAIVKPVDLSR